VAKGFLADGADLALRDAIKTVEQASAAEVVIAVRARAQRWVHVHVLFGVVTAFAALGFMLWSAHPFGLVSIWIDPFVAGVLAAAAVQILPMAQRGLTPRRARRRAVRRAAMIAFHERGVRRTTGRTGLLVYVALTERMAVVVPDDGVVEAAPAADWRAATAAIDAAVARGGKATAAAIAALADVLGPCLPCSPDDVNELPDDIDDRADDGIGGGE
jgi:putative membrane protein